MDALTVINEQPTFEVLGNSKLTQPPFGMGFKDWFEYKKGLGLKKSNVRSQVKRIAKNGENKQQGYKYAEAADIYDQINDIMHECKLGFDAEYLRDTIINAKNGAPINKVHLLITWTDLDSGYFEQQEIAGFGLDYGDKGIYKAYTGAAKYSLVLNFLIPTGDDPARGPMDPENDKNDTPQGGQDSRNSSGQGNGSRNQSSGNRSQSSARGNSNRAAAGPSDTPPPPNDAPPQGGNQKNEPTGEQKQAAEQPQGNEQANGASEQTNAAQGQQEAAEDGTTSAGPITSEQVGLVKQKVLVLAAFADDKNKKAAQDATYQSLSIKPELRAWGERVKGKSQAAMIEAFTTEEADKAIEYLDAWKVQKERAKGNK